MRHFTTLRRNSSLSFAMSTPFAAQVTGKKVGEVEEEEWAEKKAGSRERARRRRAVATWSFGGRK